MSVSRNNELLRANQSYSTKCLFYFVSIALGSLQYPDFEVCKNFKDLKLLVSALQVCLASRFFSLCTDG